MKRAPRLVAALGVLVATLVAAPAAHATTPSSEPSPSPSVSSVAPSSAPSDPAVPSSGATISGADMTSAEASEWFQASGPALLRAHGSGAWPDLNDADIAKFTIKPGAYQVLGIQDRSFVPTDRWLAVVVNGSEPVGVLSARIDSKTGSEEIVSSDTRLVTVAAAGETPLVYDADFSAWFAVGSTAVEPADDWGKKVIAGSIPIEAFFDARDALKGDSSPTVNTDPIETNPNQGSNLLSRLLILLGLIAIVVVTLLWLRWDQNAAHRTVDLWDDEDPAPRQTPVAVPSDELPGHKPSFKDSAGHVAVYQRPKPSKVGSEATTTGSIPVTKPAETPEASQMKDMDE